MTWNVFTNTTPKARKDYHCQASDILLCSVDEADLVGDDLEKYLIVKSKNHKISKGDIYNKCDGICDGEPSVFRAIPEADELCIKFELYDE